MAREIKPFRPRGELQIAEVANGIIDPVLARRAGISTALLGSWDEIAGEDLADCSRPEKISWPRRDASDDAGGHQPGVLTIACEGARALFLTHTQGELIARINAFFGFPAVRQIRIVQKPVSQAVKHRRPPQPLKGEAARRLEDMMEGIESEALKKAVARLGTAVLQKKR
ncbi:MAG TPA: DUF721 domain-containing protein [Pseudorhizobium sp.]|nr:DUF721 domain-containing protein [Pseudorhizobium sp.]